MALDSNPTLATCAVCGRQGIDVARIYAVDTCARATCQLTALNAGNQGQPDAAGLSRTGARQLRRPGDRASERWSRPAAARLA